MKDLKSSTCRLALIQAEPILFDKEASLTKAIDLIGKAAAEKAELIVFPELFIPGYPVGMNFGFSVGKRTEEGVIGAGPAGMMAAGASAEAGAKVVLFEKNQIGRAHV